MNSSHGPIVIIHKFGFGIKGNKSIMTELYTPLTAKREEMKSDGLEQPFGPIVRSAFDQEHKYMVFHALQSNSSLYNIITFDDHFIYFYVWFTEINGPIEILFPVVHLNTNIRWSERQKFNWIPFTTYLM